MALIALFLLGTSPDKQVHIAVDGRTIILSTAARTVGQALAEAGIRLGSRDRVVPETGALLRAVPEGRIEVFRSVPLLLTADGVTHEFSSSGPTVADAVRESGVAVEPGDEVWPQPATPLVPGMAIRVVRITYKDEVVREVLPYPVERREDDRLPYGLTRVLRKGQAGEQEVTYRVKYADGQRVGTERAQTRVVKEPVPQVMVAGAATSISRGGQVIRFSRAVEVVATAYTPGPESCGPNATGYTCTGLKAGRGIVAVDPAVIPLGTRVYVDGYGFAVAGDTGGAIKGNRIDVCYETLPEAYRWGKRRVIVYVLP